MLARFFGKLPVDSVGRARAPKLPTNKIYSDFDDWHKDFDLNTYLSNPAARRPVAKVSPEKPSETKEDK